MSPTTREMYHTYAIIIIICTYIHIYILAWSRFTKDQEMTKNPRVIGEGWKSQKQLSGPAVQKKEEKSPVSSSKALTRFSSL